MSENELSTGECATLACLLEVTAPKPGNVHRGADFENLTFWDFVASAVAIGPVMQRAAGQSLGQTVLEGSRATRSAVATNTNLGTVLLIAPLATVARGTDLADGIQKVLQGLDADDSRLVYEAIRLAEPGGLGKTDQHDIADPAPTDLIAAMRTGADHDLVARQYTNGFSQVLGEVVAWLRGPIAPVMMIALLAAGFHHLQLGLAEVVEDYVHNEAANSPSLSPSRGARRSRPWSLSSLSCASPLGRNSCPSLIKSSTIISTSSSSAPAARACARPWA